MGGPAQGKSYFQKLHDQCLHFINKKLQSEERLIDSQIQILDILNKAEDDETKLLILAKILYDLCEAEKYFNLKSQDEELLRLKTWVFLNLADPEKSKTDFFESSVFFKSSLKKLVDNNARDALRFLGMQIYCQGAAQSTQSSASQETIASFNTIINSNYQSLSKLRRFDSIIPDFYLAVGKEFSTGDDALILLQKQMILICEGYIKPEEITDIQTELNNTDRIKNRLLKVPTEIIARLERAESSASLESNKTIIRAAKNFVTQARGRISDQVPADLVRNLRETRRINVNAFNKKGVAATSLMAAIEALVLPYISCSAFQNGQLKTFAALFEQIPFSSQYWYRAYENIVKNFALLDSADKLIVIRTLIKREEKLSKANPLIPSLISQARITSRNEDDPELKVQVGKHNSLVAGNLKEEEGLNIKLLTPGTQLEPKTRKAIQNIQKTKELFDSNFKKAEAMQATLLAETAKVLQEKFGEDNIPADLEGRLRRLEELLKPLSSQDGRKTLQHLIIKGKEALYLDQERRKIAEKPETKKFAEKVLRGILTILLAARVIDSGMVGRRHQSTHIASVMVGFMGETLSLPIISAAIGKAADAIELAGQLHVAHNAEILNSLTVTNTGLELFAEKLTLKLSNLMSEHLSQYEDESVEKIAQHCIERFKSLFLEFPENAENDLEKVTDRYVQRLTQPNATEPGLAQVFQKIYGFFASPLLKKHKADPETPASIPALLEKLNLQNSQTETEDNSAEDDLAALDDKGKEEHSPKEKKRQETPLLQVIRQTDRNVKMLQEQVLSLTEYNLKMRRELMERQLAEVELARSSPDPQTQGLKQDEEPSTPINPPSRYQAPSAGLSSPDSAASTWLQNTLKKKGRERASAIKQRNQEIRGDAAREELKLVAQATQIELSPFKLSPQDQKELKTAEQEIKKLKAAEREKSEAVKPKRIKGFEELLEGEQEIKDDEAAKREKSEAVKQKYIKSFKELLESEKTFCEGLEHLCQVFMGNLQTFKKLLGKNENYPAVLERINLLAVISENPLKSISTDNVENQFDTFNQIFCSENFIMRMAQAIAISQDLSTLWILLNKKDTKAKLDGDLIYRSSPYKNKTGYTANGFLITIVQRLPRYEMLLEAMHKNSSNDPDRQSKIDESREVAKIYTKALNESLSEAPKDKSNILQRFNPAGMWNTKEQLARRIKGPSRALNFGDSVKNNNNDTTPQGAPSLGGSDE